MAKIDLESTFNAAIAKAATVVAADPGTNVTHHEVPAMVDVAKQAAAPVLKEAQARYEYATNTESPFASWGNNAAGIAIVSGVYGMVEALWDGFQPADDKTAMITGIGCLLAAGGWIVGRWRGKPIGQ